MNRWKSNSILLLSALCVAPHLRAQATAIAPTPAQLTTATTAFLANAGMDNTNSLEAYNTVYQGLYTWNHFKLQPTPATAELSLELQVNGMITDVTNGSSIGTSYLRLVIRDTKTGALLWSLLENVRPAARQKTLIINIDAAAQKLLTDLKAVTSAPTSAHP